MSLFLAPKNRFSYLKFAENETERRVTQEKYTKGLSLSDLRRVCSFFARFHIRQVGLQLS